jgi:diguanylate cyclase (GGDEF)-like protein
VFNLLKFFSIASLLAILSVTVFLGIFYRQTAQFDLIRLGESKNIALTQAFINSIWPEYYAFIFSASFLGAEELRNHSEFNRLREAVLAQMDGLSVVKVKIYDSSGWTVFSTDPDQIGEDKSANKGFKTALSGKVASELTHRGPMYDIEGDIQDRDIITSYLPIIDKKRGDSILGVFELYSDVTPLIEAMEQTQIRVVTGVSLISASLYIVLFFIVKRADEIIKRQEKDRKRAEDALVEQAIRDSLTGLYNRWYFNSRISGEVSRADRNSQCLSLLLCDLDKFKAVNDTRGHQTGDEVLKAVAKVIQNSTRESDLVFRWGGDEIVILLSNSNPMGENLVAKRIRTGVAAIGKENSLDMDMSIGIARYPEHASGAEDLIRVADLSLYLAKKDQDKVHIGMEEYHLDEHSIKIVFQPVVALQPIVDIRQAQILGYEALSRDPEGRLSILELFKKYQAIGKLEELKRICFRTQLEAARIGRLPRIFINVDFNVLSQVELVAPPPGTDVVLEISENEAIRDIDDHLEIARKWREMGYKFAIDDFGAGFVSFPFIARFVPDYIKVDRTTLLLAVSSENFREFLKYIVIALERFSTEGIIGEGIETEEELDVIKNIGIHLVQGFLFGRPEELK